MKGNMKESSKLFRSMGEMHVEPSDVIYNTMIHGYCKEDNSYRALRLLREMEAKGLVPNVASYSSIIGVLCKDGKWEEAEVLLDKMIELQLKPSASILNMISKAKNFTELKI
jgi:pentatricopeptide repeat protein